MTTSTPAPAAQNHGRAGRNLPAAIATAVVLIALIIVTLVFWKTAFMFVVAAAVVVAVWELHRGFGAKGIDLPEQPLMVGGVIMVVVAYFWGPPALVTATAVAALGTMLWLLRRGVDRLRAELHGLGLHPDLRAVPRVVRRPAARAKAERPTSRAWTPG